jgi:arabinose-5-phosphate isomerase
MTATPKTIGPRELATAALAKMEQLRITSLVVVDSRRVVLGVLHIHDLWRTQMF